MVKIQNAEKLAVWLASQHPGLFKQLAQKAQSASVRSGGGLGFLGVSEVLTVSADPCASVSRFGGFWDSLSNVASSVGSGIVSAGSKIGSTVGTVATYLSSEKGLSNLSNLANTYFQAQGLNDQVKAQSQIAQLQIARTAAGQSPASIGYQTDAYGNVVPTYYNPNGSMSPLTSSMYSQLAPSALSTYLPYILGGVALLGVALLVRK